MSAPLTITQVAEKSILDLAGRQTYLGNGFILPTGGTSVANTNETPVGLIINPAGSGKSLFLFNRKLSTNNNMMLFRFYLDGTVNSAGSATVALNLRSGATTASVAQCYLTPTMTANGTLLTTIPAQTTMMVSEILYILDPGHNLLITAQQAGAGTTIALAQNAWYEI